MSDPDTQREQRSVIFIYTDSGRKVAVKHNKKKDYYRDREKPFIYLQTIWHIIFYQKNTRSMK